MDMGTSEKQAVVTGSIGGFRANVGVGKFPMLGSGLR
jgi:hypothetical protein